MKTYILATAVLATLVSSARAADDIDWANVKPTTVLKAISMFESDPGGTNGTPAMAIVVSFAEASTSVHVVIDSGFLPWLTRKPEVEKGEVLLSAFVAGNIRPQLQKQIKQDHPVDGLAFMCRVYRSLRKKNLIEKIPELEQWSKMDRNEITKLIPRIRYKKSQQPAAQVQSEGAPSD